MLTEKRGICHLSHTFDGILGGKPGGTPTQPPRKDVEGCVTLKAQGVTLLPPQADLVVFLAKSDPLPPAFLV